MKKELQLTKAESDVWDWAVDAARDYWSDDAGRDDGKTFNECPVEFTIEGIASFEADDPEIIEDMVYRLDTQLRDMACDQGAFYANGKPDKERMSALAIIPVINRVLRKIAAA